MLVNFIEMTPKFRFPSNSLQMIIFAVVDAAMLNLQSLCIRCHEQIHKRNKKDG